MKRYIGCFADELTVFIRFKQQYNAITFWLTVFRHCFFYCTFARLSGPVVQWIE